VLGKKTPKNSIFRDKVSSVDCVDLYTGYISLACRSFVRPSQLRLTPQMRMLLQQPPDIWLGIALTLRLSTPYHIFAAPILKISVGRHIEKAEALR